MSSHGNFAPKPDKPERRWRLGRWFGAVTLSVLASMGATEQNNTDPSHTQFHPVAVAQVDGATVQAGVGFADILPGDKTLRLPGVELALGEGAITFIDDSDFDDLEEYEGTIEEQFKIAEMEWARLFSKDAKADEPVAKKQVEKIVTAIVDLVRSGTTITSIDFLGTASDEDEYCYINGGDNPGLGIDSKKNKELALVRAKAIKQLVKAMLRKQLTPEQYADVVDVMNKPKGKEIQDDTLNNKIEALAKRLNMTAQDLVATFNRNPKELPKHALVILNELKKDRAVIVKITSEKPDDSGAEDTTGGLGGDKKNDGKSIVFVPVYLPSLRRRRNGMLGIHVTSIGTPPPLNFPTTTTRIGTPTGLGGGRGRIKTTGTGTTGAGTSRTGGRVQPGLRRYTVVTHRTKTERSTGTTTRRTGKHTNTKRRRRTVIMPPPPPQPQPKDPTNSIIPRRERTGVYARRNDSNLPYRIKQPRFGREFNGRGSGAAGRRGYALRGNR